MKVLLIFPRVPFPARDGGAIAMLSLLKSLRAVGVTIDIFFINTSKHFVSDKEIQEHFNTYGSVYSSNLNNDVTFWKAFMNLFTGSPFHLSRFFSESVTSDLTKLLNTKAYDLVHFDGLQSSVYLELVKRVQPAAKTVLRAHNVEHRIWKRISNQSSVLKKWYLMKQVRRLRIRENEVFEKVDSVVFISEVDKKSVEGLSSNYSIGTGVELSDDVSRSFSNRFYHLGSLDWQPNLEGLGWFVKKVWPSLQKQHNEISLQVAGRNTPKHIHDWESDDSIKVLGEIESVKEFVTKQDVLIVPLLSGSGIRIKILEAMAMGKTVISTRIGAEGLHVFHKQQILFADSVNEFEEAIAYIQSKDSRELLIQQAYAYIRDNFSIEATGELFKQAYTEIVNK